MTPLEAQLTEENAALRAQVKAQQIEVKLLKEKIDLLVRRIFGAKSEQLDDAQLMLLQGDDEEKKPQPPAQTPASWRLRSTGAPRTTNQASHAENARRECPSICPPSMK